MQSLKFFLLLAVGGVAARCEGSLFASPGRLVPVGKGSHLSLYCLGKGSPTIVLESGFGGGTAATWMRLQPLLGEVTRTCSYDRAGYGFSRLGSNLPRDLNRAVADLEVLLRRSGERGPYILAGHSNGGLMIGAFANRNRERVAALMFFDAAVALPEDLPFATSEAEPVSDLAKAHLEKIRGCLARAKTKLVPAVGDPCVDPRWYSELPRDLANAEIANRAKLEYWRAYLSEAENNYASKLSEQARALMPHRWMELPIRVFIASADRNRERAQQRQARVCKGAVDCRVERVPTANHLVHNEALSEVVEIVRQLVAKVRRR